MQGEKLDFQEIFSEVTQGNKAAFDFCAAFLCWAQVIDDAIDKDQTWSAEVVIRVMLDAMVTFASNPFWQAHKRELMPLIFQGAKAFADSNRWAQRNDFRDRASADVLKAQYQEVFWYVAKIVGGWEHYGTITEKYRHYHYDVRGKIQTPNPQHPEKQQTPSSNGEREKIFAEVCLGNEKAAQFCYVFLRWCHWIDDVIDKDKERSADDVVRCNLEAMAVFSDNEFFQRHVTRFLPLIAQSFRSFGDSIEWEKRKSRKHRRAADVLKSNYHEVFWHASYLAAVEAGKDGWDHMSAMTAKYREFDWDYKG